MIRSINTFDIREKNILIRVDFNVPLDEKGLVEDNFRIRSALPTIKHCLELGASVILMSHLGRPGGKNNPELSLVSVGEELAELLEMPIKFSYDPISEDALDTSLGLKPGEVHLLENLRFHPEEEANDYVFSSQLAKHGQIYINDAFGTAHRAHASNVGVPAQFKHKGIGLLVDKEIEYLQRALKRPSRPVTLILGGAKIGSKLGLIESFLDKAETIIIGGGMAFTFLKANGVNIGHSLLDETMVSTASRLMEKARQKNVQIELPVDVMCGANLSASSPLGPYHIHEMPSELMGLDIGPKTIEKFTSLCAQSGTVVWNGPMGLFEINGFGTGTMKIAVALESLVEKGGTAIVGGGDSVSAVKKYGLSQGMSHVSTGGGASLELLSGNTMPALQILEQ
ncbi:MAG: phosphoglycerate kinase [Candidatus Marinimicrobia bacterium]|nr:phosphoglycerate kinase [Candidatus Neomarinimicrobiota bacterium]MBT3495865.1 phosphoglycerate kinase [Candidatus Neomarinimicrobiota bacterium]MBT3692843.1 phosphoglycerate kinase [Candidatus Neomarinimicrobiota bacterium]MBT3731820.1 phosphoglycerate kinase [Candidatus Neomarinimicrobiota bacterium]MBT4144318.1 phosphoglycerate kinase [Candidatus Neomarinimicrobiota bacterium]